MLKKSKIIFLLVFSFVIYSCSDDDTSTTPEPADNSKEQMIPIQIELTDAPGDYQEVNINLKQIRVQKSDSQWYDLTTNAGYYDLITLQNGLDTTIVKDSLSKGTQITGLRMILGDSNNVMVDSVYYNLKVPSGSSSGYKIQFNDTLRADSLNITIDFDADKSLVKRGKGDYLLKPVLKIK